MDKLETAQIQYPISCQGNCFTEIGLSFLRGLGLSFLKEYEVIWGF